MYIPYVGSFQSKLGLLSKLNEDPSFVDFMLNDVMPKNPTSLDLQALLITPVQRVPRYRLLLQDLIKRTHKSHGDYSNLLEALEEVKHIAARVDADTAKAENMRRMQELSVMCVILSCEA